MKKSIGSHNKMHFYYRFSGWFLLQNGISSCMKTGFCQESSRTYSLVTPWINVGEWL